MADRTLTINHADGDSETYTIKRDKFAGVRSMSVDGNTVTVDHTAIPKAVAKETTFGGSKSITVKREIEPLLSEVVGGASAAYSLRDLNDKAGNNKVVRVRRASDNHEKDFRAKEIKDIETWVNAQTVLPLDIQELEADGRTGDLVEAAAAYSLRNLSDSYAGDVVEVRRNTDGSTRDFNATEVSDNTLTDWVNTSFADDLPLDTSSGAAAAYSLRNLSSSFTGSVVEVRRSSDGEEDSFTASDVSDGTLEDWVTEDITLIDETSFPVDSGGFESTISGSTFTYGETLDGKTDVLYSTFDGGGLQGLNFASTTTIAEGDTVTYSFVVYWPSDNTGTLPALIIRSGNTAIGHSEQSIPSADNWHTISGSFVATQDATSLTLYVTSSTGRVVGDTLAIASGSYVVTSASGFVSKWYDQSGNANHATQGTNASQPKIVDAGSLVSGGLDFDGVDDFLTSLNSSLTDYTFAGVYTVKTIEDNAGFLGKGTGSNREFFVRMKSDGKVEHRVYSTGSSSTFDTIASSASAISADTAAIIAGSFNGTTNAIRLDINGTVLTDTSSVGLYAGTSSLTIPSSLGNEANTTVAEFIIYDSDQSDKLRAIEENIGDHYGITLASFSNDGFVKTWYDQSGNTNHATQAVDASQPKIVSNGSYLGYLTKNSAESGFNAGLNLTLTGEFSLFYRTDFSSTSCVLGGIGTIPRFRHLANQVELVTNSGSEINFSQTGLGNANALYSLIRDSSNTINLHKNGVLVQDSPITLSGNLTFTHVAMRTTDKDGIEGQFYELIIYNSDQSDNRTAIEANIGDHYSIDLPSGVDTGYDQVDGFVETWYDQSGNGNDAVQQVSGSQPKIVDGGVLVSGGLDFDGVDDELEAGSFSAPQPITSFSVFTQDSASSTIYGSGGSHALITSSTNKISLNAGTALVSSASISLGAQTLVSALANSTSSSTSINGGNTTTGDAGTTAIASPLKLGNIQAGRFTDGKLQEIIIYDSDQSANREAIEANINNQYDIY